MARPTSRRLPLSPATGTLSTPTHEWAAESPFGERIAHGMLVLSYAIGLLPIDPERVVALRAIRNVVFKRPVEIGSTIRAEAEVAAIRPLDDEHSLVELSLRVRGTDGRLVARGTVEVLWRGEGISDTASSNGSGGELELSPLADGRVLA